VQQHGRITLVRTGTTRIQLMSFEPAWIPKDISVDQTFQGEAGHIGSRLEVGAGSDAQMFIDIDYNGSLKKGTILMLDGRWFLTQGFTPEPGFEMDTVDQVVLNSQLVTALLNAALPTGAPAARTAVRVNHSDTSEPVRVATASASAQYGTPWHVDGTVSVSAAGAPANYHLAFTFVNAGRAVTTILDGSVANSTVLAIPDSTPLKDWSVYKIGSDEKSGYGAKPVTTRASTVGELRKLGDGR
jgi:hypothetical protein